MKPQQWSVQAPSQQSPPVTVTPSVSRLPKLSLLTFSGNPLDCQSFWDSFEAAVHSNSSFNGIQRFNYLKAQLQEDAQQAITGFPLANSNYKQAVNFLKERYGQPHRIVSAHMEVLLDILSPNEHLDSFQGSYDTLETHIPGLASLGKGQESYGDLWITIIPGKLPNELRRNLAREHGALEWAIGQLRKVIQKELKILEARQFVNSQEKREREISSTITSSFDTGADGIKQDPPPPPPPSRLKVCVY